MTYDALLASAVAETGEEMLFQSFERADTAASLEDAYWSAIHVTSPARFDLELAIPAGAARAMAHVLYGDMELNESQVADLVAEVCNTVAGALARRLSDASRLELSPPEKGRGAPPQGGASAVWFVADEVHILVCVAPWGSASVPPAAS
jgi:Chemotaxis phosphatase CheX